MMMDMREDFVETPTGRRMHFLRPDADEIHLDDIALGLSRIRRFNGSANRFYSVAEHSVLLFDFARSVSVCDNAFLRAVLFHDASEAYLGDIPGPVKRHLPDYRRLEHRLMEAIAARFSFPWPLPYAISEYDFSILNDERRQLLRPSGNAWLSDDAIPLGVSCECWTPEEGERHFMAAWQRVYIGSVPLENEVAL